jgi:hypothetical protein
MRWSGFMMWSGRMGCTVILALAAGCETPPSQPEAALFPPEYPATFTEVRGCRPSVEHDLRYVIIRVSAEAAAAYDQGPRPLPEGTIVVKEEYGDPGCAQLLAWTAMRKEPMGYFPAAGDWRWQRVNPARRVIEDGMLARCASCHRGCAANDFVCAEP